ncbi:MULTISPECIES: permease prefix domain 1-containing protein [unclassified Kribbella]|uniref:permease prefix domain 1-containing protein n=1 Tax=unclassified Kribbella TaxID=2644121 RepID=UPI003018AA54
MADRDLIQTYLAELARRLPAETVEELADGLEETFQHQLRRGLSPAEAADAAISEFGRPAQVTAAFAHQSLARHTAIALLATAPVFAGLWGATLITAHVWTWQLPPAAVVAFGAAVLAVAATFGVIARSSNPTTARLAGPASAAVMLLDLAMMTAVVVAAPALSWPMVLAVQASLVRVALTGRNLPHLFTR